MEYEKYQVSEYIICSSGMRFLNYIIDLIFMYAVVFFIFFFIGFYAAITQDYELLQRIQTINNGISILIWIFVILFYYGLTEVFLSRSLSKFLTKTVVVMADGSKPTKDVMFKRTLCRFIPFDAFTYLFRSPARGFHDTLSETYVVKKKDLEIEKYEFEKGLILQQIEPTITNPTFQ